MKFIKTSLPQKNNWTMTYDSNNLSFFKSMSYIASVWNNYIHSSIFTVSIIAFIVSLLRKIEA